MKNVLFYLTPKENTVYLEERLSIRQALEKMEVSRYTVVPVISDDGKYIGSISEGDILWFLKREKTFEPKQLEKINILEVPRNKDNVAVYVSTDLNGLIDAAYNQNFVPVIDDRNYFIGIVTRKKIIDALLGK